MGGDATGPGGSGGSGGGRWAWVVCAPVTLGAIAKWSAVVGLFAFSAVRFEAGDQEGAAFWLFNALGLAGVSASLVQLKAAQREMHADLSDIKSSPNIPGVPLGDRSASSDDFPAVGVPPFPPPPPHRPGPG